MPSSQARIYQTLEQAMFGRYGRIKLTGRIAILDSSMGVIKRGGCASVLSPVWLMTAESTLRPAISSAREGERSWNAAACYSDCD